MTGYKLLLTSLIIIGLTLIIAMVEEHHIVYQNQIIGGIVLLSYGTSFVGLLIGLRDENSTKKVIGIIGNIIIGIFIGIIISGYY